MKSSLCALLLYKATKRGAYEPEDLISPVGVQARLLYACMQVSFIIMALYVSA